MSWLRTTVVRILLKILWSVGGKRDEIDGLPRLHGSDLGPLLERVRPGDCLLFGNNGVLTHVAVFVGDGAIVHAMATEKTMRGWFGSLVDAVKRTVGRSERYVGVIREPLVSFADRYERDTWVITRFPDLTDEQVARGIARIGSLVGQPYDYGFKAANEAWYCTEIADEFLRVAAGDRAPTWVRRPVKVPLLLSEQVIEPVALLEPGAMQVVAANRAAVGNYREAVASAEIVG